MNGRELAFCAHYAVNRNAEQAMLAAGYSRRTARGTAYDLLRRPHIQEQLNHLARRANQVVALDAAFVLNGLAGIATVWPGEYLEPVPDHPEMLRGKHPDKLSEHQRMAVKDIKRSTLKVGDAEWVQEYNYVLHDKMVALVKLGDHFGVGSDDPGAGSRGNPFEGMTQEALNEVKRAMEKAMDTKAIEVG